MILCALRCWRHLSAKNNSSVKKRYTPPNASMRKPGGRMPCARTLPGSQRTPRQRAALGKTETLARTAHRTEAFSLHGGKFPPRTPRCLGRQTEACARSAGRRARPRCACWRCEGSAFEYAPSTGSLAADRRARAPRTNREIPTTHIGQNWPVERVAPRASSRRTAGGRVHGALARDGARRGCSCAAYFADFTHCCRPVPKAGTYKSRPGLLGSQNAPRFPRRRSDAWRLAFSKVTTESGAKVSARTADSARLVRRRMG